MSTEPSPIRVAVVQCDLATNDVSANLAQISETIRTLSGQADLAVLPETFTTGFSADASAHAEFWRESSVVRELARLSHTHSIGIAGSLLVRDGGSIYNRFILIDGDSLVYQDKRHLFSLGGEPDMVSASRERKILSFRGWRIMPLICYDLRFPVWSRCIDCDYDLIIAVASWPRARRKVWQTLLVARAMENLAYSIGVNRIGIDGQGLSYAGDSSIIDPRGEYLAVAETDTAMWAIATLEYKPLADLRRKFPVWQDADTFTIEF